MKRIKENLPLLLMILLVVLALVYIVINAVKVNKEVKGYKANIAKLETQLSNIGDTTTAYILVSEVEQGKKVEETDLEQVEVPNKLVENVTLYEKKDLLNKYYNQKLPIGTILCNTNLEDFEMTNDLRYLDVYCDELPIGLKVGDYVDIRITFAFGQEYIALSKKKVVEINSGVIKVIADQKDIHTYESMKTDKALYEGTVIKAIQYLETGVQEKAQNYYPMSAMIAKVLLEDPNTKETVPSDILTKRTTLEKTLETGLTKEVTKALANEKKTFTSTLKKAYDTLEKEIAKANKTK